jgi:hypothetical protein
MKTPFKGANVLFYDSDRVDSARITAVHSDGTVSLVSFPSSQKTSNFQSRHQVAYGPGEVGCWGWNDEFEDVFMYVQDTPASTWTISHSKGRYLQVLCFSQNGNRVEADESQPNLDQVILRFNPAIAGFAILR